MTVPVPVLAAVGRSSPVSANSAAGWHFLCAVTGDRAACTARPGRVLHYRGVSRVRVSRRMLLVIVAAALAVSVALALWVFTDRPLSFPRLAADAATVPVPAGVTFVGERRFISDGPGFTTSKSEQVTRTFTASVPCQQLLAEWTAVLDAQRIRYTVHQYPQPPGIEIVIRDGNPEFLGVTLGLSGRCGAPFVWSFNRLH